MAAVSAAEKVDRVISMYSQRLQAPALQRLSVSEIMNDSANVALAQESIPTRDELRITTTQDSAFSRLLKFLSVHEPTGYEHDEAHKRTVVQYFALRTMLAECRAAKLTHVQEACVAKVLHWFDEIATQARTAQSVSVPILPPKMSPKKQVCGRAPALCDSASTTTLAHRQANGPASSASTTATPANTLERYKMPDLRASHIRRIAELKSRGTDVDDELAAAEEAQAERINGDCASSSILNPEDYDVLEQQRRVDATFRLYQPETSAERAMNLLWLDRRSDDAIARRKQDEVTQRVAKWSIDRSRDESELLRKREAAKLVAGLERSHDQSTALDGDSECVGAHTSSRQHHSQDDTHRTSRPRTVDEPQTRSRVGATQLAGTPTAADARVRSSNSSSNHSPVVVIRTSTTKQDVRRSSNNSRGSGGGGMHYRNELPANYAPPSQHSNQSSLLSSSSALSINYRDQSAATPTSRGSNKPTSERSNRRLRRSDSHSSASSGSSGCSDDDIGECSRERALDDGTEDAAMSDAAITIQQQRTRAVASTQQQLHRATLEPYHVPHFATTDARARGRNGPRQSANNSVRMYPRGTLPPQDAPCDPECRQLYDAAEARRVVSTPTVVKQTDVVPRKASTVGHTAAKRTSSTSARSASVLPGTSRTQLVGSEAATASSSVSALRQHQQLELEKIQRLFAQHNLSFSDRVFETGLFVPEDRSALECAQNLPLAGSLLASHPLVHARRLKKRGVATKKKKKKKKGGAAATKKKTKEKSEDVRASKSPRSTSRSKTK